ncbi:hypothetical protein ACWDRX_30795, partial [Streptomyces nigra]
MTLAQPAASRAAEILSRPAVINGLTVPNRIVMAPMAPGTVPVSSEARGRPPTDRHSSTVRPFLSRT